MTFHLAAGLAEMNNIVKNIKSGRKYKMFVVMSVYWDYGMLLLFVCFYFFLFSHLKNNEDIILKSGPLPALQNRYYSLGLLFYLD